MNRPNALRHPAPLLTRNRLALSLGMLMGLGVPSLASASCVSADATHVVCSGAAPILVGNAYANNTDNLNVSINPGAQVANFAGIGVPLNLGGNNVTLTNNGTVDPSLLGLVSVLSKGVVIGNGSATSVNITNNGTLNGVAPLIGVGLGNLDGVAVDARVGAGGRATILNAGTIGTSAVNPIAGISVLAPDANVITVSGGGQADITNTGTINGRVGLSSSSSTAGNTFYNAGTIVGSVGMGGGNDSFVADTASSVSAGGGTLLGAQVGDILGVGVLDFAAAGVIDGGDGIDTLGLVGTGESTASADTYQNFEVLNVGSGRWHIAGLLGSAGTLLNGGTAVVSNGADLGAQIVADGGALEAETNPVTITAPVELDAGGLTVQGDAQPLILSGPVTGVGGLVKNGTAELDLTGTNGYLGGTTLNAGILGVSGSSALGTGDVAINGGTLTALPGDAALANRFHLNTDLDVDGANNLTLSGVVDGAGPIVKNGTGTLTLQGANTYGGGTFLNDGTVSVAGTSALGTGDVFAQGGILDSADPAASLNNTIHADVADLIVGGTNDLTLNGPVTGLQGIEKDGSSTLTLNGPASYLGATVLNAGVIKLGNSNALGSGLFEVGGTGTLLGDVPLTLGQDVLLDPGSSLTLSSPNTTLNGTVDGDGALIVAPAKTVTLNGANTYTGPTVLQDQATLNVGNDSALGTGTLIAAGGNAQTLHADLDQTLANPIFLGGPLTTTDNATLALTGPIDGPGSLIQAGPGTLELDGASTYSGGTTVTGGTLRVGNDAALGTGPLTLNAGTTLTNDVPVTLANPIQVAGDASVVANADLTANGALSGAGNLTKDGAGVLTLGGDLSAYTGQLKAIAGTLTLVQPLASGLSVGAGATVNLSDGGNAPIITAPIAGTLNLGNGANTLNIPVDQFGQLTGTVNGGTGVDTLNVINTGDGTWAPGTLTGIDQIAIRAGANVLLGDGISRPTDAPDTLVEGGLALNGSLGSDVTVAPGGTLVGHGTVDGNLIVNGTLAPSGIEGLTNVLGPVGPVPQALAVTGNATINTGSEFIVRTQPDGTSDHLDVTGAATLNGGNVTVHPLGAADGYGLSTAYNIVNASGGLTGNFSTVTQTDLPFLTASLSADPTHAILTLGRSNTNPGGGDNGGGDGGNPGGGNTGGGDGGTPGGGNPGGNGGNGDGGNTGGTDGNAPPVDGPGGSMGYGQYPGLTRNQRNMANTLQILENREVALNQATGIEPLLRRVRGLSADQVKPVFDSLTGESYVSAASQAAASARHNSQTILAAGNGASGATDSNPSAYRLSGAWVTLLGNNRTAEGTGGVADQHVQQRGVAAGVDGQFDNGLALGPFIATDRTSFDPNNRYDDGKIRQTTLGVRLQQNLEPMWWRVLLGYGWTHMDMDRGILLPGYTASRAHGQADGHVLQGAGELGWTFRSGNWDWAPVAGVYYTRATFDHVNERNANEANLSVAGTSYHETVASLGIQGGYNWTTASDGAWRVEGSVKGFHNFNADPTKARTSFAVDPSSSYTLVGATPSKQWVELGAGVRYTFADRWSLSAGYGVALGGREKGHGVNLGVSMTW